MSNKALLKLTDFRIDRGDLSITDINWSVHRGEHWCILGPNGCGKTSLLSSITAYSPVSGGRIELFGKIYGEDEWHVVRQAVGIVSTGLLPYIEDSEIAEELVVTGKKSWLTNWGPIKRSDRSKAQRILKKLNCERISRSCWGVLSQGERQRVLIARVLMAKIKILILDEPCSGLDPVARKTYLDGLEDLAQSPRGPIQIMVTHHVEEIIPSCTHVLLMGKDRIIASGEKSAILNNTFLSEAYGNSVRISKRKGSFHLQVD